MKKVQALLDETDAAEAAAHAKQERLKDARALLDEATRLRKSTESLSDPAKFAWTSKATETLRQIEALAATLPPDAVFRGSRSMGIPGPMVASRVLMDIAHITLGDVLARDNNRRAAIATNAKKLKNVEAAIERLEQSLADAQ
jgi:hypothetical protein